MLTIFRNGGFPMYFIVGFGLVALVTAFLYAVRPAEEREGFVRWMSLATLFSIFCGTAADLAAVSNYVATHPMDAGKTLAVVVEGVGESMSPSILGFALLSLVASMMAVGRRRLDARKAA